MFKFFKRQSASPDDFKARVIEEFERELTRRKVAFSIEADTGLYKFELGDYKMAISLENLLRDAASDRDLGRVARFVDTILATPLRNEIKISADRLFWCLEPNDYVDKADFRVPVSDKVDRVLTHYSADEAALTWVTPGLLEKSQLSAEEAEAAAWRNLEQALAEATIEFNEINGVRLGFVNTKLPFKASLLLAPNLRACVEPTLGWPLQAIAPDRNFLYLWASRHEDFVNRVGGVCVKEYKKSSYPLSTEVYAVEDGGIRALGAFPVPEE